MSYSLNSGGKKKRFLNSPKIYTVKKIYTLAAFSFFLTNLIFAQAPIPNASFETWNTGEPTAWGTSDGILVGFGLPDPTTAEQDTAAANVYAGSSSVRLTNKNVTTPFGAQDIPGVVSLGTIGFDLGTFSPTISGYAYTDRPDSVRFAAKYTSGPGGTDTGNVAVTLTKWTPGGRIVIGNIRVPIADVSSFTVFTAKITYHSALAPDTLLVQGIATSSQTSVLESQLWLDDFSFLGLDTAFKAYINPGTDVEICDGDTVRFRTDNMPPNTYQWFRNDVPVNAAAAPQFFSVTEGTYYVQVTNGGNVYTSDSMHITLNPLPAVSYTVAASQDTVCLNSAVITLTGATPPTGIFIGDAVDSAGNFNPSAAVAGPNDVTYSVTNVYGCTASVTQVIFARLCTGIEVLEEGLKVNIYPNPAADFMTIETDQKLIGGSIEVFDALGKLVLSETITSAKSNLNVGVLNTGLYTVRLLNTAKKAMANAKIGIAQ